MLIVIYYNLEYLEYLKYYIRMVASSVTEITNKTELNLKISKWINLKLKILMTIIELINDTGIDTFRPYIKSRPIFYVNYQETILGKYT